MFQIGGWNMSLEGKQIDRYAILHLLGNGTLEMASQLLTN